MSRTLEQLAALTDADWAGANPPSPAFRDDPYQVSNALREKDPVNQTPIGPWRICRYSDIAAVFESVPTSMTLSDGTNPNFDPLYRRDHRPRDRPLRRTFMTASCFRIRCMVKRLEYGAIRRTRTKAMCSVNRLRRRRIIPIRRATVLAP